MYTIFKVLIRNSIKGRDSDEGFTLLELIFGLLVMVVVGGTRHECFDRRE